MGAINKNNRVFVLIHRKKQDKAKRPFICLSNSRQIAESLLHSGLNYSERCSNQIEGKVEEGVIVYRISN